ncbi:Asialoglycoprotein receptor 2 [Myotis davidii]|uniref:Asialoglycoprotein receptor 2 n=1 Tax=Myotis davidii TaxID=225400 RepID=L5LEE7_MYODS|nr:Asialoglycoprotein receptor 2 [Myotis davidii]
MEKDFQDIQQLDPEENDHQLGRGEGPGPRGHSPGREDAFWKGKYPDPRKGCVPRGAPPPQPLLLRTLCSSFWLSLLILGFNVLLLVAVCVVGSQRAQMQREFWALKDAFSNFSASALAEIRTLSFHDHTTLLFHLKHFPADVRILSCQMAFLRSNGTECCPVNWLEYEGSCYWFSRSGLTWPEAEKYCQLENAHLVVINSREEQRFIAQHSSPFHTWIGLTESNGSWKWVDGTDYGNSYRNWAFGEPNNWQGHEQGGNEDCAELREDGRWNDDFCLQVQRWACEMTRNITG